MRVIIMVAVVATLLAVACGDRPEKSIPVTTPTPIQVKPTPTQATTGPVQPVPSPTTAPSTTAPSGQLSFSCTGGTGTMLFDVLFPSGFEYHEKGVADPVIGIRVIGCFTNPMGVSGQTPTLGSRLATALFSKPSGYQSDDEFYSVAIALLGSFLKDYTAPTATLITNGARTGQILQVAPLYRQPPATTGPRA